MPALPPVDLQAGCQAWRDAANYMVSIWNQKIIETVYVESRANGVRNGFADPDTHVMVAAARGG